MTFMHFFSHKKEFSYFKHLSLERERMRDALNVRRVWVILTFGSETSTSRGYVEGYAGYADRLYRRMDSRVKSKFF